MKSTQYILPALTAAVLALAAFSVQATPTTSYYVYNEAGHVIGEYDQNGNPIQEHIYLGDRPVAVVQNGNASTVDYVTTDQLNTPRAVTDSSQSIEWSLATDPFGNGQPTGSLTYNLRFPGQYYDQETGHNYNYYRDYDPQAGRYIESDPFGLKAGLNTYTYVDDMPLELIDRFGLFGANGSWGSSPAGTWSNGAGASGSWTPVPLYPYDPNFGPSAANCSSYPPGSVLNSICSGTPNSPGMNCARNCIATHYPGRWGGPVMDYVFYLIPEHPICWWECRHRPTPCPGSKL